MRFQLLITGIGIVVAGCSGGPSATSAPDPSAPPSAILLQYVGEYGASEEGAVSQIVLHVDGKLDAVIDGVTTHGTFEDTSASGDASATLRTGDGEPLIAFFHADTVASSAPPQVRLELSRRDGDRQTLVAAWVAGNEGMCGASGGNWHDDDPDPTTGLYCVCPSGDLYLPSRGGCVAPRGDADPPRRPPSNAALRRAGIFDGDNRVSSITLATDGRYVAKIDHRLEQGTWWDATYSPSYDEDAGISIGCTSAWHALDATLQDDGTLTIRLGADETETLRRRSE